MQIALVAAVLFAGMWFTVLRPKSSDDAGTAAPVAAAPAATSAAPAAPGAKGLSTAVEKAKGAAATSDAANAKVRQATGEATTTPAAAKPAAAQAKAPATATPKAAKKPAKASAPKAKSAAKPAAATTVDPSQRLLAQLAHGKVVVLLFHGDGADDRAAAKAVDRLAARDDRVVVSRPSIASVGRYEAITSGVQVMVAPTVVVIGKDRKARTVTGYTDVDVLRQMVGDARRAAAKQ